MLFSYGYLTLLDFYSRHSTYFCVILPEYRVVLMLPTLRALRNFGNPYAWLKFKAEKRTPNVLHT